MKSEKLIEKPAVNQDKDNNESELGEDVDIENLFDNNKLLKTLDKVYTVQEIPELLEDKISYDRIISTYSGKEWGDHTWWLVFNKDGFWYLICGDYFFDDSLFERAQSGENVDDEEDSNEIHDGATWVSENKKGMSVKRFRTNKEMEMWLKELHAARLTADSYKGMVKQILKDLETVSLQG